LYTEDTAEILGIRQNAAKLFWCKNITIVNTKKNSKVIFGQKKRKEEERRKDDNRLLVTHNSTLSGLIPAERRLKDEFTGFSYHLLGVFDTRML